MRQDGGWVAVDPTLQVVGGVVKPKATKVDLSLSDGGTASAVSFADAAGRVLGMDWAAKLPAPTLSGDTATYANVLPNIDVTAQARPTGYELNVVVNKRPATAPSFTVPLRLKGLTVAQDAASGALTFTDSSGAVVERSSAPTMYDASTDPATGIHGNRVVLATKLVQTAGGPALQVSPDAGWLSAPSTVYPVTIDPSGQLSDNLDTYVVNKSLANTNYDTSGDLYVGYNSYYGTTSRSFLRFDDRSIKGRHVTSAVLNLAQDASSTCAARSTVVEGASGMGPGTTWNTQPTLDGRVWASANSNSGKYNNAACAANVFVNVDVTGLVAAWAGNGYASPETLALLGGNETDGTLFKTFYSGDTFLAPHISVTYNSYPGQDAGRSVAPTGSPTANPVMTDSLTPTLTGGTSDPDGGTLRHDFEVYAGTSATPTTLVASGSASAASGSVAPWTVPAGRLTDGQSYEYRVRAFDGLDYGPWSAGWVAFGVDTQPPAAPAVSSSAFPRGQFVSPSTTSGTFSWTDSSPDVASYTWWLDNGTATTGTGTSASVSGLSQGAHTFHLQATDNAGNQSQTDWPFGIGNGVVTSPADGARTQAAAALSATSPDPTAYPWVQYQFRVGTTGPFTAVPAGRLSVPGGGAPPANAYDTYQLSAYPSLAWDVRGTVPADGLVQVQACFATSGTVAVSAACTPVNGLALTSHAFGDSYATQAAGPGTVSLLTGDYSVSASDVTVPSYTSSLSVGRSLTTLAPSTATSGAAGIFGPGWTASITGPASGAGDQILTNHSGQGFVLLTGSDGAQSDYQLASGTPGATGSTYVGTGDASDGSVLTKVSATTFSLADTDGTTTTWVLPSAADGASGPATSVAEAGSGTTSTVYDSAGLPRVMVGPAPAGVSCPLPTAAPWAAPTAAGCRSLAFRYATSTAASSDDPAGMADYAGRLVEVDVTAVDPATNVVKTIPAARYGYDTAGLLVGQWDPRISPKLVTTYGYDSNGRLASLTPPGLAPWTMAYTAGGQLSAVSRRDPALGRDATTRFVYGAPWNAPTDPNLPNLSGAATAGWGQDQDLVATATAVFPADHDPGTSPASADWPYGDIHYLDVNGRQVDDASYGAGGWQVDSTQYDKYGNDIWSLTADNRSQALHPTAATDPVVAAAAGQSGGSVAAANLLATVSTYSDDGSELVDTLGPTHPVRIGTATVDARAHTHNVYDQGAPTSGGPYQLITAATDSAQDATTGSSEYDPITTTTGYAALVSGDATGWALREPTSTSVTTTSATGAVTTLTNATRYDPLGRTIETRLPGAQTNSFGQPTDARTTVTAYYTADSTGGAGCGSKPALAGMVCSTGPAAPVGGALPSLLTTRSTFNVWGQPLVATETDAGGTVRRTTTTSYDPAGRTLTSAQSGPAGTGTALPTATAGYDPATGLVTTMSDATGNLSTGYDSFGRPTSYTDADGNTSSTSYDIDGRTAATSDGKGTTSFGYDGSGEHRGLLTSENTGMGSSPSAFSGSYDAAGRLVSQTLPNGIVATSTFDNAGNQSGLRYTGPGTGSAGLAYTADYDPHGKQTTADGPISAQAYSYDHAGRISTVTDAAASSCTTRVYGYDTDTNRTSLTAQRDPGNGTCVSPGSITAPPTNHTYDAADRLTDPGYTYDNLGRTSTVPASDVTGGTSIALSYYTNDMVRAQSQGSFTDTFGLDASENRIRTETASASGLTQTNHYGDGSDSPVWTDNGDGTWIRNITDLSGVLAATQTSSGTAELQLADLHGNITATVPDMATAAAPDQLSDYTEFGQTAPGSGQPATYGAMGADQRSTADLGGLSLMGVRLYAPLLGRFLQVDPILHGSANAYDYVDQDPANNRDPAGLMHPGGDNGPACKTCTTNWAVFNVYYSTASRWYYVFKGDKIWQKAIQFIELSRYAGFQLKAAAIRFRNRYTVAGRWYRGNYQIITFVQEQSQNRFIVQWVFFSKTFTTTWHSFLI